PRPGRTPPARSPGQPLHARESRIGGSQADPSDPPRMREELSPLLLRGGRSIELPAARNALELVLARIDEGEAASGDEILDRPRHQDLRPAGPGGDPGADRYSETAGLAVDDLALTY